MENAGLHTGYHRGTHFGIFLRPCSRTGSRRRQSGRSYPVGKCCVLCVHGLLSPDRSVLEISQLPADDSCSYRHGAVCGDLAQSPHQGRIPRFPALAGGAGQRTVIIDPRRVAAGVLFPPLTAVLRGATIETDKNFPEGGKLT